MILDRSLQIFLVLPLPLVIFIISLIQLDVLHVELVLFLHELVPPAAPVLAEVWRRLPLCVVLPDDVAVLERGDCGRRIARRSRTVGRPIARKLLSINYRGLMTKLIIYPFRFVFAFPVTKGLKQYFTFVR